jgi:hypothetical protein
VAAFHSIARGASITLHRVAELIVFSISLLQGHPSHSFLGIDQLSSSVASQTS